MICTKQLSVANIEINLKPTPESTLVYGMASGGAWAHQFINIPAAYYTLFNGNSGYFMVGPRDGSTQSSIGTLNIYSFTGNVVTSSMAVINILGIGNWK